MEQQTTSPKPTPEGVTPEDLEKMLKWLDFIRATGIINMFGAGPELARAFKIDRSVAGKVHVYWMETFGDRHPNG